MAVLKRKIVEIDEAKCNGCGECIPNCHEGALAIVDGKAKLVSDVYCDGLGACLGNCPEDAIRIVERAAQAFDPSTHPPSADLLRMSPDRGMEKEGLTRAAGLHEAATEEHLKKNKAPAHASAHGHAGCPSAQALSLTKKLKDGKTAGTRPERPSELTNWPVQIALIPPTAPYLKGARLLIAADCVGFAMTDFHDLLEGKALIIACPKLDDTGLYVNKLAQIFAANNIASVTVAHMEVPCCFGLKMLVEDALTESGKDIPLEDVTIAIEGTVKA